MYYFQTIISCNFKGARICQELTVELKNPKIKIV